MSLILCPECGTKISTKALVCPYCGYSSQNPSLPISEQENYEVLPTLVYEIEQWNPEKNDFPIASFEDNRNLVQFFSSFKNIQSVLPDLAEIIKTMATDNSVMIAKIDPFIKKMIENGTFTFAIDKSGEILPTIRDSSGFVKQVRLEKTYLNPNITQTISNLNTHIAMAQILEELDFVGNAIQELHIEMQNERIARAESAREKLLQAFAIQNTRLREVAVMTIINAATEENRVLMKSISYNLKFLYDVNNKKEWELIKGGKKLDPSQRAADTKQAIVTIINTIHVQCHGYAMLGEYEAGKKCLLQFKEFVLKNNLNELRTLDMINGALEKKYRSEKWVDSFFKFNQKLGSIDNNSLLDFPTKALVSSGGNNE